jgi:hypothetical protein
MASELHDLMSDVEVTLVETVARLERAKENRLYVDVLELEQRVEALHHLLASVADSIVEGSPTHG